jgi:di/tricarboxylate transporter
LFGLLAVTIVLFASDRVRLDAVAVLAVLALMLSGVLSPAEALAGFGDSVVLPIAGLFVVSEGLFRTGVAYAIGNWLMRVAGTSEIRLLVLLILVVALLSAFMSSTGAVAIFIPVALNLAAKINVSPSQLMMPIAFASLMGGYADPDRYATESGGQWPIAAGRHDALRFFSLHPDWFMCAAD